MFMLNLFNSAYGEYSTLAYNYSFSGIDGKEIRLDKFQGKVIVIVNVASRCGYTPQYEDLQKLWTNYKNKNLVVIGVTSNNFKQETGSNQEI